MEILQFSFALEEDLKVVGINTSMVDYKLAWLMNQRLHFEFVRQGDIVRNGGHHAFFYYKPGENSNIYNLSSNYADGHVFLDKMKPRVDYFLIIKEDISEEQLQSIISKVRSISGINYAFLLDLEMDKRMDQTLETIELHENDQMKKLNDRRTLEYAKRQAAQNQEERKRQSSPSL